VVVSIRSRYYNLGILTMKILITNTVVLNAGDAAILKGVIKLLQNAFGKNTKFIMYDSQPEIARKYYPDLEFRQLIYWQGVKSSVIKRPSRVIHFLNRQRLQLGFWFWERSLLSVAKGILTREEAETLLEYHSADLIVSTGGTYLVENYSLVPRILDYKISLNLKKDLVFFTQSLGPFHLLNNQRVFKEIFDQAALVLLRDSRSEKHLLEIGVKPEKLYLAPDAAFALGDLASVIQSQQASKYPVKPRIAISVREWGHFKTVDSALGQEKYLKGIRDLTIHLVEAHQAEITFLSTCQGIPEYHLDDSKVALEVFDKLPQHVAKFVSVNRDFHSPEDLATLLRTYDLAIATRLHMAILSLGTGVPVFPIAYEFKTKELFEKLGQGQWVVDIEEIESQKLVNLVDQFLDSLPEVCQALFPAVQKEIEAVFESSTLTKLTYEEIKKLVLD